MPLQDPKRRCKLPSGREWKCKPPNDPMDSREQGTLGQTPGPPNNRVKSVDSRPEVPDSRLSLSLKVNPLNAFRAALLLPGTFRTKSLSARAAGAILCFAPYFPFHKFVTHPSASVTHFLRIYNARRLWQAKINQLLKACMEYSAATSTPTTHQNWSTA